MPKSFPRSRRVGDQIQRTLSTLIRREIKDPRLGSVTLTEVQVASDLAYAKVFYAVLGGSKDPALTQEILEGAAGFLRGPLGRALGLRHSPELRFVADNLLEDGAKLHALVSHAVQKDNETHTDDGDDNGDTAPPAGKDADA
jgi:ribosome-binding factor A